MQTTTLVSGLIGDQSWDLRLEFQCVECGQRVDIPIWGFGATDRCPGCKSLQRMPRIENNRLHFHCADCRANVSASVRALGTRDACPSCKCAVDVPRLFAEPANSNTELAPPTHGNQRTRSLSMFRNTPTYPRSLARSYWSVFIWACLLFAGCLTSLLFGRMDLCLVMAVLVLPSGFVVGAADRIVRRITNSVCDIRERDFRESRWQDIATEHEIALEERRKQWEHKAKAKVDKAIKQRQSQAKKKLKKWEISERAEVSDRITKLQERYVEKQKEIEVWCEEQKRKWLVDNGPESARWTNHWREVQDVACPECGQGFGAVEEAHLCKKCKLPYHSWCLKTLLDMKDVCKAKPDCRSGNASDFERINKWIPGLSDHRTKRRGSKRRNKRIQVADADSNGSKSNAASPEATRRRIRIS